jgi:hypothetical protein
MISLTFFLTEHLIAFFLLAIATDFPEITEKTLHKRLTKIYTKIVVSDFGVLKWFVKNQKWLIHQKTFCLCPKQHFLKNSLGNL